MIDSDIRFKPLKYIIAFNLFTIFIFITAPLRWESSNILLFLFLIFFSQLALIFGFTNGSKKYLKLKQIGTVITNKRIKQIFAFYSVTFLIKYAYILRFYPYQISEMFNFLLIGVVSPDIGYKLSLDSTRAFTIPWTVYFVISIINQVFFIIGYLTWKRNGFWLKLIFTFFIIIELFFWFGRGTNFGIISLITTFLFSRMVLFELKKSNFNKIKNGFFLALLVVSSVFVFSYNLYNRRGGADIEIENFDLRNATVDMNHISFKIIPKPLHETYMYLVSYLSQGYYHTALSLDLDYVPTFLFGNNPAAIDLAELLHINIKEDTYVYRLQEKGIDPEVNWHSSYTWYASDVTYFGVPFVFYVLGYLFGCSWVLSMKFNDFLSQIVFVILCNMLLFTFANNNYLSNMFYSSSILFPYWYFNRVKCLVNK